MNFEVMCHEGTYVTVSLEYVKLQGIIRGLNYSKDMICKRRSFHLVIKLAC